MLCVRSCPSRLADIASPTGWAFEKLRVPELKALLREMQAAHDVRVQVHR